MMDTCMLNRIYDVSNIPIYIVKDGKEIDCIPSEEMHPSPFKRDASLVQDILTRVVSRDTPILYLENENIYYGAFKDQEDDLYLFGPMSLRSVSADEMEIYRHTHRMQARIAIPKRGLGSTARVLALAYYCCTCIDIAHQDIPIASKTDAIRQWNLDADMENYQLEQSEEERVHSSIAYENRILEIVRNGDIAALKEMVHADLPDMEKVGVVAANKTKQTEYLMVAFVTLITRAAIDGGLNPEQAYEMGDLYLQQLEKCTNTVEMELVSLKAQLDMTQQVHEARQQRSQLVYIEKCKDYIARHLRKPFKVGDIAPAIGVNRSYLTKRFSEVEGMTIQQYIMRERCEHAANLLKYSRYPISIISEYFCFASQSHFIVQFKKLYGMTPNEYRKQYRYIESYDQEL